MTLKLIFPWALYRIESFRKRKCLISHFSVMCLCCSSTLLLFFSKSEINDENNVRCSKWPSTGCLQVSVILFTDRMLEATQKPHVWPPPFSCFMFPPSFEALSIPGSLPGCHIALEHLLKSVLSSCLFSDSPPIYHQSIHPFVLSRSVNAPGTTAWPKLRIVSPALCVLVFLFVCMLWGFNKCQVGIFWLQPWRTCKCCQELRLHPSRFPLQLCSFSSAHCLREELS